MQQEFHFSGLNITPDIFRQKALRWAEKFPQVTYFDNNEIPYLFGGFEKLLAVSSLKTVPSPPEKVFETLNEISASGKLWCGLLSYDLKNQIEKLESKHEEFIGFPGSL